MVRHKSETPALKDAPAGALTPRGSIKAASKEPHQSAPRLIKPVVWSSVSLIAAIASLCVYGVLSAPTNPYPYMVLFAIVLGAWAAILAFLGRDGRISISLFGKKVD